jgi:hypothetical protein
MELRWAKVQVGVKLDGNKVVNDYQRVLQYRTKMITTDYSKYNLDDKHITKEVWSEWKDVPEEE